MVARLSILLTLLAIGLLLMATEVHSLDFNDDGNGNDIVAAISSTSENALDAQVNSLEIEHAVFLINSKVDDVYHDALDVEIEEGILRQFIRCTCFMLLASVLLSVISYASLLVVKPLTAILPRLQIFQIQIRSRQQYKGVNNLALFMLLLTVGRVGVNAVDLQPVAWRWMTGSSAANQFTVCGVQGLYSSSYSPGSRYNVAMTEPSIASGHVTYAFGGRGYHTTSSGELGDMWGYRQTSWSGDGEWAWLGGLSDSSNYQSQYPGPVLPGGRYSSVSFFVPGSNKVFILGGEGHPSVSYGKLNEVWSFDVSSNTWSFVKGSSVINAVAVTGTMGTAAAANTPGGIMYHNLLSSKSDGSESLIFGGFGYFTSTSLAALADVWRYNSQTNEWTWMNGPNAINTNSVGGAYGVYSSAYQPSSRYTFATMDTTHRAGSSIIYLFGGFGRPSIGTASGNLGDLWAYDKAISQWAYITGDSENIEADSLGSYGTMSVFSPTNHPGCRNSGRGWSDPNSDYLVNIFGGYGYDEGKKKTTYGFLDDFWSFNTSTELWSWGAGDSMRDQDGVYAGPVGSWFSSANKVGPRRYYDLCVNNDLGLMLMFGGSAETGRLNEMWVTKGSNVLVGVSPTVTPAATPTHGPPTPTASPSASPTVSPTVTSSPSASPSSSPSASPSTSPTTSPSASPSASPTVSPTASPSASPTTSPSPSPTWDPSVPTPTTTPTATMVPTPSPTPATSGTGSGTGTGAGLDETTTIIVIAAGGVGGVILLVIVGMMLTKKGRSMLRKKKKAYGEVEFDEVAPQADPKPQAPSAATVPPLPTKRAFGRALYRQEAGSNNELEVAQGAQLKIEGREGTWALCSLVDTPDVRGWYPQDYIVQ